MDKLALWFLLLFIYQEKHFFADYPLQTPWMLGKFKPFPHFILPLSAHAAVHAAFTMLIAVFVKPELAVALGLFDGITHFIVDFIKANPSLGGRWTALSKNEMGQEIEHQKYFRDYPYSNVTKQSKPIHDARLKSNRWFWYALGQDQKMHHYTHYIIIYFLVR